MLVHFKQIHIHQILIELFNKLNNIKFYLFVKFIFKFISINNIT